MKDSGKHDLRCGDLIKYPRGVFGYGDISIPVPKAIAEAWMTIYIGSRILDKVMAMSQSNMGMVVADEGSTDGTKAHVLLRCEGQYELIEVDKEVTCEFWHESVVAQF